MISIFEIIIMCFEAFRPNTLLTMTIKNIKKGWVGGGCLLRKYELSLMHELRDEL